MRRTTNSQDGVRRYPNLVQGLVGDRPDRVWISDITTIQLQAEDAYRAFIMDMFTRAIRGWQLSRSLNYRLTLGALQDALIDRVPDIHHSDQGVQYIATPYIEVLTRKAHPL